jgi:eukaryotic-like serine/threonine-protein kinase
MQTATTSATSIDTAELPAMLATLCYYQDYFGPYHPQTLRLMTRVGIVYSQAGEQPAARALLERVVRDLARVLGADHELRLRAIAALRDLFAAQGDYERAVSVQKELLECQLSRLGSDHPETLQARAKLANLWVEELRRGPRSLCPEIGIPD